MRKLLLVLMVLSMVFMINSFTLADDSYEDYEGYYEEMEEFESPEYARTVNDDVYIMGNVGIDTTTPQGKLQIGNGDGSIKFLHLGDLWMGAQGYITAEDTLYLNLDGNSDGIGDLHIAKGLGEGNIIGTELVIIKNNGKVGIGTTSPDYTLHVNGTIGTTNEGQVHSDYVFEPDYKLRSLEELEAFIEKEKHLPGVVTDPERAPNVDLLKLNGKLLEKIEELTLYVIKQNKALKSQDNELKALKEEVAKLKNNPAQ